MEPKVIAAEFADWAEKASGVTRGSREEAELLLELLRDHLDIDDPGDLQPADLEDLLLDVYPRNAAVLRREDLEGVIPSMRDLLVFLRDTGRVPSTRLKKLEHAMDWIEPGFVDAAMDSSRSGPHRTVAQVMAEDGVDVTDPHAVSQWMEKYDKWLADAEMFGSDDEEDDLDDDDLVDLKEVLDLPDRLPALRLPSESELAAAARDVELIGQARRLALWVGERPRRLRAGELTAADAVSAAQAAGLEIPMKEPSQNAFPGMPVSPKVRRMADLPRLVLLWGLAEGLEFIELDDASAAIGPGVADWADGNDEDVLDVWSYALADTISRALPPLADRGEPWDVDDSGFGAMLLIMLFLARDEGMPVAEIREVVRESATEVMPAITAEKAWRSWTARHGDPTEMLLDALSDLRAITVEEDTVRLTPLSLYATRLELIDADVEVPLLPSPEEMTAADLIEVASTATEDELAAEEASWLRLRGPEAAVDELLALAADGGPTDRMPAVSLALRIGVVAEERWRRALDEPTLRPYAKIALAQFAGAEPGDIVPSLEPTLSDLAWVATDTIAVTADAMEPDELVQQIQMVVPSGQERAFFELIWRLDHPNAHEVLATIGRHHPDKAVAKAARKAAYKIRPSPHRH